MEPALSIVIPNYNHADCLPRMFDSILAQSLKEIEVIVVDGGSAESYDGLIEQYRAKGLDVKCIMPGNKRRYFIHESRIIGMREAKGKVLCFLDADDVVWGNQALEKNVQNMLARNLDILHVRTVQLDEQYKLVRVFESRKPYATYLERPELFEVYCKGVKGHVLWELMISRDLCKRVLEDPFILHPAIKNHVEDFFLKMVFVVHAHRYAGASEISYGHRWKAHRPYSNLVPRFPALAMILYEYLPHLQSRGYEESLIRSLSHQVVAVIAEVARLTMENLACEGDKDLAVHRSFDEIARLAEGPDILARSFMLGYPLALHAEIAELRKTANLYTKLRKKYNSLAQVKMEKLFRKLFKK